MANSMYIGPGEGQAFYEMSMNQLDFLVIGELEAKRAMLGAMVIGANGVVFGPPGGGKSTLIENAHNLIAGIDIDRDVAFIPPHADLTAKQLVGGAVEIHRSINGTRETTRTQIEPIIKPTTRIIIGDEINRTAPHAVNSILPVLESRKVATTEGSVALPGILYVLASMNPTEKQQGVFPITAAAASRFRAGGSMGKDRANEEAVVGAVLSGWTPSPDKMSPTTDIPTLMALRARALSSGSIAFPDSLKQDTIPMLMRMGDVLRKTNNEESPGRIARQLRENAQVLAMFDGQESITDKHIREGILYITSARLGMLGTRATMPIEQAVDKIVKG